MFHSLSLYAFLNAKVKAMFSSLLDREQIAALDRAKGVDEFIRILQSTPYRDAVSQPEAASHPRRLEKDFTRLDIALHQKIMAAGKDPVRGMVFALLGRYDLQNFKAALRLWYQPQEREEELPYLITDTICYPLKLDAILSARSLDDLLARLGDSPYRAPLLAARDQFQRRHNLLPLEAALDTDYFARLEARIDQLGGSDRKIARSLIGTEIDIENIKLLIRLREYYHLPWTETLHYLIPFGNRINPEALRRLALSSDLRGALTALSARSYPRIVDLLPGKVDPSAMALLEGALSEILMESARARFRASPFTIATVLAYLLFKAAETRYLVSSLYAKFLAEEPG